MSLPCYRGAQSAVEDYLATAVEMIVGALLAGGAFAWVQLRAYVVHTRWAAAWAALTAPPRGEVDPTTPPGNATISSPSA